VILRATISKNGSIADLKVVSGPAMLQQAAFNAVQQWHYKPYVVDNQPTDVETTITVSFGMGS
jgi:protein TonB